MRAYRKYVWTMVMVWAVCFVLFAIAHFSVIAPRLKVKAELAKKSIEKRRLYEVATDAANEDSKKKLAEEVENVKNKLSGYIIEFQDSANLTFDISRIAAEKQVGSFTIKTVDQVRDTGQAESKNLQENYIGVAFESDFKQFATFLNTLERHRPVVFIDRFKISRGRISEARHQVDMDIAIFVKKRQQG